MKIDKPKEEICMVRIAVIDDIEYVVRATKKILEEYDFGVQISVDTYVSGKELLRNAVKVKYDILIMDIELSEEHQSVEDNGMYLASMIKTIHPGAAVIYITGTVCHKSELLAHEPFRYIEKPIEEKVLYEAVCDAVFRSRSGKKKNLFVRIGGINHALDLDEVTYFESNRRKITAYMDDDNVEFYEKMNDLAQRVSEASGCFVRVGKSYLVNMHYIRRVSRGELELCDSTRISISRKYKDDAVQRYERYMRSFKAV